MSWLECNDDNDDDNSVVDLEEHDEVENSRRDKGKRAIGRQETVTEKDGNRSTSRRAEREEEVEVIRAGGNTNEIPNKNDGNISTNRSTRNTVSRAGGGSGIIGSGPRNSSRVHSVLSNRSSCDEGVRRSGRLKSSCGDEEENEREKGSEDEWEDPIVRSDEEEEESFFDFYKKKNKNNTGNDGRKSSVVSHSSSAHSNGGNVRYTRSVRTSSSHSRRTDVNDFDTTDILNSVYSAMSSSTRVRSAPNVVQGSARNRGTRNDNVGDKSSDSDKGNESESDDDTSTDNWGSKGRNKVVRKKEKDDVGKSKKISDTKATKKDTMKQKRNEKDDQKNGRNISHTSTSSSSGSMSKKSGNNRRSSKYSSEDENMEEKMCEQKNTKSRKILKKLEKKKSSKMDSSDDEFEFDENTERGRGRGLKIDNRNNNNNNNNNNTVNKTDSENKSNTVLTNHDQRKSAAQGATKSSVNSIKKSEWDYGPDATPDSFSFSFNHAIGSSPPPNTNTSHLHSRSQQLQVEHTRPSPHTQVPLDLGLNSRMDLGSTSRMDLAPTSEMNLGPNSRMDLGPTPHSSHSNPISISPENIPGRNDSDTDTQVDPGSNSTFSNHSNLKGTASRIAEVSSNFLLTVPSVRTTQSSRTFGIQPCVVENNNFPHPSTEHNARTSSDMVDASHTHDIVKVITTGMSVSTNYDDICTNTVGDSDRTKTVVTAANQTNINEEPAQNMQNSTNCDNDQNENTIETKKLETEKKRTISANCGNRFYDFLDRNDTEVVRVRKPPAINPFAIKSDDKRSEESPSVK